MVVDGGRSMEVRREATKLAQEEEASPVDGCFVRSGLVLTPVFGDLTLINQQWTSCCSGFLQSLHS